MSPRGTPVRGACRGPIRWVRRRLAQGFNGCNPENQSHALSTSHEAIAHALMQRRGRNSSRWRDNIKKPVDLDAFLFQIVSNIHEAPLLAGDQSGHAQGVAKGGRRVKQG